jgi:hypothetical protein
MTRKKWSGQKIIFQDNCFVHCIAISAIVGWSWRELEPVEAVGAIDLVYLNGLIETKPNYSVVTIYVCVYVEHIKGNLFLLDARTIAVSFVLE